MSGQRSAVFSTATVSLAVSLTAAVAIVFILREPITRLIDRAHTVTVKSGDFEIGVKTGAALSRAEQARQGEPPSQAEIARVSDATKGVEIARLSEKTILWVDDNPRNNAREARIFETLGMTVKTVTSGEAALAFIASAKVDVIISDFKRGEDPRYAGYGLLSEIKSRTPPIPYIIYAGETTAAYRKDAQAKGALTQTSSPTELFSAVMTAVSARD